MWCCVRYLGLGERKGENYLLCSFVVVFFNYCCSDDDTKGNEVERVYGARRREKCDRFGEETRRKENTSGVLDIDGAYF
jgi:hypothetical protein